MDMKALEQDVVLAGGGDLAAFTRIVHATSNTVCTIALAIVRNVQASEDVAQETFLAAWQGLSGLRNPASILPWLRQVTRHQAHIWLRTHRREVIDQEALQEVTDDRPAADAALIAAEEKEVLAAVLDELSDEAREVLVLYYREGSSAKQVAELLGLTEEAVRQRLSRSRALLREETLQRFGKIVRETAPGGAFVAALAATLPAPAAAALLAVSPATAATTATVVKAGFAGALLGWIGVFVGMKFVGPPGDEAEARALRQFRNSMLAIVAVGSIVVAISSRSLFIMAFAIQLHYAVIAWCYLVRLPRILQRRNAGGSPTDGGQRRWRRAAVGGAFTAALTGSMLMATLILATRLNPMDILR
jgi:RNA polymerase sigma factor (sigma-70 family)